jgi:exopolysaccharide production protein ExoQ
MIANVEIGPKIHFLWIFLLAAVFLELQFVSSAGGFNYANALFILVVMVVYLSLLIGGSLNGLINRKLQTHDWFYLAYISYCGSTAIWSVNPAGSISLFVMAFTAWLGSCLMSRYAATDVVAVMLHLCFIFCLISLGTIIFLPQIAYQPSSSTGGLELRGIFEHQLRLGLFAWIGVGLLVLAFLNGHLKSKIWLPSFLVYLLVIAACTELARARLYSVEAILSIFLTIFVSRFYIVKRVIILFFIVLGLLLYNYWSEFISFIDQFDFDTTLTGRTTIWEKTIRAVSDTFWYGYGFSSFTNEHFNYYWGRYRPSHAHNSYIQAYFETGVIGLVLLVLAIFSQMRACLFRRNSDSNYRYSYALFLLLLAVTGGFTGLTYAGSLSVLIVLFLLVLSAETVVVT